MKKTHLLPSIYFGFFFFTFRMIMITLNMKATQSIGTLLSREGVYAVLIHVGDGMRMCLHVLRSYQIINKCACINFRLIIFHKSNNGLHLSCICRLWHQIRLRMLGKCDALYWWNREKKWNNCKWHRLYIDIDALHT